MQEITITVDNGEIKVEGTGFQSGECLDLTKGLEKALGERERQTLKPEARRPKMLKRTV
jgi:hypothetical protein